MHFQDRFRTATYTASQIPRLRQISYQTVIKLIFSLKFKQGNLCNAIFSWQSMLLNNFCGIKNIFDGDLHRRKVLFTHDSCFLLFRADGCSRIYRHHNECYATIELHLVTPIKKRFKKQRSSSTCVTSILRKVMCGRFVRFLSVICRMTMVLISMLMMLV